VVGINGPGDTLVTADITETPTGKGRLDLGDLDARYASLPGLCKRRHKIES